MKIRFSLVAMLLGTLATLSLKIYQIYDRTVNLATGFTADGSAIAIVLPIVVAVSVIGMMVVSFTSSEYPKFSPNHRSIPLGFICVIVSFVFSYYMSMDIINTSGREFAGTAGLICSILGLLSVVSFFFLAIGFFRADNMIESTPLVLIFPVSWMGMRLTLTFFKATSAANITEASYDILAMAFMLVFLLTVGKFMSGAAELSAKWAFAVGCPAAMLSFLSTIPRYFIMYDMKQNPANYKNVVVDSAFSPHLIDLCLAVFACVFLFHISRKTVTRQQLQANNANYNKAMAAKFGSAPVAAAAAGAVAYGSNAYDANKFGVSQQVRQQGPHDAMMNQYAALRARAGQAPQRMMRGGGADQFTNKGAGMKVADNFSLRTAYSKDSNQRYGGLGDFRNQMKGGRRALDVLETENSKKSIGFKPLNIEIGPSPEEEAEAKRLAEEQQKELDGLSKDVSTSLSDLFGGLKQKPKDVTVTAGPDEEASVTDNLPTIEAGESDEAPKAVTLGTGLADKLAGDGADGSGEEVKYGRRATDKPMYGRRATDNPYGRRATDLPPEEMYGRRSTDYPPFGDEPMYERGADMYADYPDLYDSTFEKPGYEDRDGYDRRAQYDDYGQEDYEYDYDVDRPQDDYDDSYDDGGYDDYEDEEYDGYDDENYYDDEEDEYYDDEDYDEDEYYEDYDEDYDEYDDEDYDEYEDDEDYEY